MRKNVKIEEKRNKESLENENLKTGQYLQLLFVTIWFKSFERFNVFFPLKNHQIFYSEWREKIVQQSVFISTEIESQNDEEGVCSRWYQIPPNWLSPLSFFPFFFSLSLFFLYISLYFTASSSLPSSCLIICFYHHRHLFLPSSITFHPIIQDEKRVRERKRETEWCNSHRILFLNSRKIPKWIVSLRLLWIAHLIWSSFPSFPSQFEVLSFSLPHPSSHL